MTTFGRIAIYYGYCENIIYTFLAMRVKMETVGIICIKHNYPLIFYKADLFSVMFGAH